MLVILGSNYYWEAVMNKPDPNKPYVKGAALVGFIKFIKDRPDGDSKLEEVISKLPEKSRELCESRIISVGDYPYTLFVDLIVTIDKVLGNGDYSVCEELGHFAGARDIEMFKKMFNKDPDPQDLFRAGDIMWRSYQQNSGKWDIVDDSPDLTIIRILEFPEMAQPHCQLIVAWMEQAMIEAGGNWLGKLKQTKNMNLGDEYHEFQGKWQK
jgi:hypothetical protein